MRVLVLLVVLLGACADEPEATDAPLVANHEVPRWAPLPPPNATVIAQPQKWVPDGRPTLMLFSASWCASCRASLLSDVAIVHKHRDEFQVGVALVENSDSDFVQSWMARLLHEVPVWSAASVREYAGRCGAEKIPLACIVDRGRVVFRGSAAKAQRMLETFRRGNLDQALVADATMQAAVTAKLAVGNADVDEIVKGTRVDHGWQNAIAWKLAGDREASASDIVLAVALARDAVAADGGLDFSLLDTYSLALSKANLPGEAATVSWRVLAICAAVHAECMVERRRAYAYIYYAREKGFKYRRW